MKIVGVEKFKESLSSALPKLCLVHSDDIYLLKQCERLYLDAVGVVNAELNLLQIDGRVKLTTDTAIEFLLTFPFMGDNKLLVVNELIPSTENIDKVGFDRLLQALKNCEDSSKCIITMRSAEVNAKGSASARAKKLLELADSIGMVVDAPMLTRAEFIRTISSMADSRGCTITREAATLLYEDFSGRLTESVLELEKLCNYRPNGNIDEDAVKLLVVPTPEARVFAVCDMLLSRQLDKAQLELGKLFFHRQTPESINQIICMTLSDIYLASIAQENGITQTAAATELRYYGGQAYRLKKQWAYGAKLGTRRLLRAVRHAVSVDMKMKQTGTYSDILLQAELVELYAILWG